MNHQLKIKKKFKIFVGGLPPDTSRDELFGYFKQFGPIYNCEPKKWNSANQKCRGFGLITCENEETYEKIMSRVHTFKNRNIECKKAFSNKKAAQKYEAELIKRKLFVKSLPPQADSFNLTEAFRVFGEIDIAYVVSDKNTSKSKCFGYVCFKDQRVCTEILKKRSITLFGRKIKCLPYNKKGTASKETTAEKLNSIVEQNFEKCFLKPPKRLFHLTPYSGKFGAYFKTNFFNDNNLSHISEMEERCGIKYNYAFNYARGRRISLR